METFYFYYLLSGNNTPKRHDCIVSNYEVFKGHSKRTFSLSIKFNNSIILFINQYLHNVCIINYVFILDDYAYVNYIL